MINRWLMTYHRLSAPPYDIITPQMEQELYLKSEYNFVRLESGREYPRIQLPTTNTLVRQLPWSSGSTGAFLRLMRCQLSISMTTTLHIKEGNINAVG